MSEYAVDLNGPASERGLPFSGQAFWADIPELHEPLAQVRSRVMDVARSAGGATGKALEQYVSRPGKMLRPALVLFGSWAGSKSRRAHVLQIATAIETLHLATLIHDDVIDDADRRRGEPALHTLYGRKRAVLMGDFLFASCFSLISEGTSRENAVRLARATSRIVGGELRQLDVRRQPSISRRDYLRRIASKTALLLTLSLVTGASETEAPRHQVALLSRLGYSLGMAFQVIDDILDFEGTADAVGKPIASDLKSGLYTLPVIEAVICDPPLEHELANVHGSEDAVHALLGRIRRAGGIRRARERASIYTGRARKAAGGLANSELRAVMLGLVDKLLERTY